MNARDAVVRNLKSYRLRREWTLKQLATVVGVDIATVWHIENGRRKPHDLTVQKIIKNLPDILSQSAA